MSRTNETRHVEWYETFTCKYKLDARVCNNKQPWNEDKCRCECEELIDKGVCDKGFIWNSSNCECECDKSCNTGEYLVYYQSSDNLAMCPLSCTLPKKAFLYLSVWARREYIWKLNKKESLLIYFENCQTAPWFHRQGRKRIMNTFIIANINPTHVFFKHKFKKMRLKMPKS